MKKLGIILIAIGLALLTFVLITFLEDQNQFHSPIPEEKGVKVIFITPAK